MQNVVPRRQRPQIPAPHEFSHDRQTEEHFRQHIVVRAARRRLGIVFREAQSARFANKKGIEARHGAGVAKTRIDARELALPALEAKLVENGVVIQRGAMRLPKRSQHDAGALLQKTVLRRRQEPRPQHGTEGPVAKE
jgi:hypothetical protein